MELKATVSQDNYYILKLTCFDVPTFALIIEKAIKAIKREIKDEYLENIELLKETQDLLKIIKESW